ncbi:actin family protein [Talaromyces stipitatus ATCC 10500]|uniref:Actin-like protein ARP6 n=1 Tax=Talaromyces stipitatus (strain ATCC 10500 / CBS 375.48 / QM 6759 / NRRL 1006) TaxID=441959 RepID=B8MA08_TALSN|nr:actin family protein [Talaromyces stipitatus ATCC 10500]EED18337.1 actin family protein [Talaromyces stipitatus ATCC 10500]
MVSKPRAPAKQAAPKIQPLPDKTFIIDNGACTIKAGHAPAHFPPQNADDSLSACVAISNAIAKTRDNRIFVGAQLSTHISDWNEAVFRRPVEKGYIVNWEAQKEIWEQAFFDERTTRNKDVRVADPAETTLILTDTPNGLPALQRNADEMVMEEWGFGGYARIVGPTLNAWNDIHSIFGDPTNNSATDISPAECLLVIDSGYSHTIVTPVYKGQPLQRGIRRLDLGGKHLTNYIKEMVSMRQYNMVDETHIMNDVKEAVCYVSSNFQGDMEKVWKATKAPGQSQAAASAEGIVVDYVLPDPTANKKGFVRSHDPLINAKKRKSLMSGSGDLVTEDFLVLGNERFTVPEILFNPSDIGMRQAGIPEIVLQSLSVLPTGLHPAFLANILVVGGNALIPGFIDRLEMEIRQLASAECLVRVKRPNDPIRSTWLGASRFATDRQEVASVAITRQEYLEYGSAWAGRRFSGAV